MLEENLQKIFSEIEKGNNLGEKITLVGAIKTVDAQTVNRAVSAGLKVVAENKVQEFREKDRFISGAEKHFIGHLQTNKVKYIVGNVSLIQSVDSIKLGRAISDECIKKNIRQNILAEINVGGELSKSGFDPLNAESSVKELSELPNISVSGLMTMFPLGASIEKIAELCSVMRSLYDKLKNAGLPFQYLSMGMSADYKTAIENGSNMIRIGSGIFGKRNYEVK